MREQRQSSSSDKEDACSRAGVLSKPQIKELFDKNIVQGNAECHEKMKWYDSAFDLHLGRECYELLGTTKLKRGEDVKSQLSSRFARKRLDLNGGQELRRGRTYLVKLEETLDFSRHPELYGRATGKSTIGRVDVLSHLVVNKEPSYDCVGSKYCGELYLQITPLTFSVFVKEGYRLSQLRLFCGRPELSEINDGAREFEHNLLTVSGASPATESIAGGFLRLSLAPEAISGRQVIAFAALPAKDRPKEPLDLNKKQHYDPTKYWELIVKEQDFMLAQKDRFYIVRSFERLCLPLDVAVDCIALSENLGDLRIHYAGFAHPTFGSDRRDRESGTPLMFEVRCFTGQVLRHEEQLAKVKFYRMARMDDSRVHAAEGPREGRRLSGPQSAVAGSAETDYTNQELQLSAIFKPWPKKLKV
jgi:dCTP deaminase